MSIIEKIIKVLQANQEATNERMKWYKEHGDKELASRCFGEWLGYNVALTMLTDETEAEAYFKIWFEGEDAGDE